MKAWASGEWVPSWLRKFREEKEERERLRREQTATEQRLDEEQDQEADEGDETELWQHRLARDGEDEPWEDVVSFMERPGMSGQEYVDLINGGIPSHLARRLEQLLRRYESYLSSDRGRGPLGTWEVAGDQSSRGGCTRSR